MSQHLLPTDRTALKRAPQRGSFDRATIDAILDDGFIAHVGFVVDGAPRVIPCVYARVGDRIYLHGSTANRMLRTLRDGGTCCLTVTHVDALILARSAFHHSVNYRSVVLYGQAVAVDDPQEKMEALRATVEHAVPGRWKDVRGPNREEFARTLVVSIPIEEASAKLRSGGPIDDEEDMQLGCWAGRIPLRVTQGEPIPDPLLAAGIEAPGYALRWTRPGAD